MDYAIDNLWLQGWEVVRSRRRRGSTGRGSPRADRDHHANRSRGLGGNPTAGAEENILGCRGALPRPVPGPQLAG